MSESHPWELPELASLTKRLRDLQETEAVSAAVIASALDCIVVADEDGCVVEFNPAAQRTFGYSREEALGRQLAELIVPPKFQRLHSEGMARYMRTGEARVLGRRVELEAMRRDGSTVPVELTITEVRLPERRLFTAHLRDLSAQKAAQAEIERQRESLFQTEKMAALGSLLAGVAHELNNPLAVVLGQAAMLLDGLAGGEPEGAEEIGRRARIIEQAAERCARIVRSFLAIARQRKTERRDIHLGDVVAQVLELLAYSLRTTGIEVQTDIPADLPPIEADPDQLHQVLLNLVVNAQQALEARDGPRRIRIEAGRSAGVDQVWITVADNGPGVPDHIRGRIFDPFFTTKTVGEGTGIGLAVSLGLAEAHGGTLRLLERSPLGGAAFELRLPRGGGAAAAQVDKDSAAVPALKPPPNRRALIVDDEPEIASTLAEILARRGYRCTLAGNGREACDRLGEDPCDLILCDIRMPDMDGPAFYRWLAENRPELTERIVFVTGDTLGPAAGRFLARVGAPVVEKPFTPAEIWKVATSLEGQT
ncbi:PAS domain S-box protein [Mesorhizobium sp. LHD-90]|uniref:ATP-binding protein n=1 Tax=Mesorhizobium sp. LHD-90 TaxID=3071414 RepID=UPI0027DEE46D|nr:ATP-binding protein [Mesorhizobium sp. LHD-90]MDQ6437199.1 PAS domain S-box protein [Mesorhizobium sp. LHD-90]